MSPSRGAARRAAAQRAQERARRIRRLGAAIAVAVVLAIAVTWLVSVVTAPSAPAAPKATLSSYHLEYRVTTTLNNVSRVTRQAVWVQRPFSSRVDTFDSDGKMLSESVNTPTHAYISSGSGLLDLGQPRPLPPPGDYHLDAVLSDLLKRKLAQPMGTRTVAGERCDDVRTGQPIGNPFAAPTSDEYVDICVSHDGLLLREDWWRHGATLRLTEATTVSRGPVDPNEFVVAKSQPVDPSLAPERVQAFSTKQLPKDTTWFWQSGHPPWGLRLVGRYRAVSSLGGTSSSVVTIDVYQKKNVLIIVTQQPAASAPTKGNAERVANVGTGRSTLSAVGADLHLVGRGVDVEIAGTAGLAELRWFARSLHAVRTT
jgi:hypothetical protein